MTVGTQDIVLGPENTSFGPNLLVFKKEEEKTHFEPHLVLHKSYLGCAWYIYENRISKNMSCILFTIAGEKTSMTTYSKPSSFNNLQIHFVSDECEIGPCGQISLNIFLRNTIICCVFKEKEKTIICCRCCCYGLKSGQMLWGEANMIKIFIGLRCKSLWYRRVINRIGSLSQTAWNRQSQAQ